MEHKLTSLDPEAFLEAAQSQTGLTDYGETAWQEAFRILLHSYRSESQFHERGRQLITRTMMRLLTNRLKIQEVFVQRPEILKIEIPRPVVILGLPRTGTTLLHNLMACDPKARFIRLWEGLWPAPPAGEETAADEHRKQQARELVAMINQIAPELKLAHELVPEGPEECLWVLEHTFQDLIFELRAHVPTYSKWLAERTNDPEPYAYHRKLLQLMSAQQFGNHWVLKAPRHFLSLKALIREYPDARLIQTHRQPEVVVGSICNLCRIDRKIFSDSVSLKDIGELWLSHLSRGIQDCLEARNALREDRTYDVHYPDLMKDPMTTVRRIYEHHQLEWSEGFETRMKQWLQTNRQHKHGKHEYSLEDYSLSVSQVRDAFGDYLK